MYKENSFEFYQHIDNGGIEFKISNDADGVTELKFLTHYFGYPAVEAKLSGYLWVDTLRSIAKQIMLYASHLEIQQCEQEDV